MDNNPKNISNDYNKSGFQVSLESIVSLISVLSVTIVVGFLLLLSFFNGDAKGFILVIGLAIWYFILANPVLSIQTLMGRVKSTGMRNRRCEVVKMGWFDDLYVLPSVTTSIFGMIVSYLIYPMTQMSWRNENFGLILGLSVLTSLIIFTRTTNGCESVSSLGAGLGVGLGFGIVWYYIISSMYPDGVYHGYFSNDAVCSVEAKTFVCKPRDSPN